MSTDATAPMAAPDPIDAAAVAALDTELLDWRFKAIPAGLRGRTVAEARAARPPLSLFPSPTMTLTRSAVDHNRDTMAAWCADRGLALAPHGKTTMAPQLWAEQLAAGAWGITVANAAQVAVARAFGVRRVLVANAIIHPGSLAWIGSELADPQVEILLWADSVATVELMDAALADTPRRLPVLVELGAVAGRAGARTVPEGVAVATAIAASAHLELAGVAGYEGAIIGSAGLADGLQIVRSFVADLIETAARVESLFGRQPIVSAGGSAWFDAVADGLAPIVESGAALPLLRSGAYLTHDDGMYRAGSPLGAAPRSGGPGLRPALQAWTRVVSAPEPGLVLVDAGKRDVPYDVGLPEVQQLRRDDTVSAVDAVVQRLNDQHGFLASDAELAVGDWLRLGVSHPCTAFDKWALLPVIEDADAADPTVVDFVRTFF